MRTPAYVTYLLAVLLSLVVFTLSGVAADSVPTVGVEGQVEVLLPGPELKAKPLERDAPVTVRIASTRPHGTLISYDLRYIGLVPGRYDLRRYLLNQDGSVPEGLPPIEVSIAGLLPPDHQGHIVLPNESKLSYFGGYRAVMGGVAVLWILSSVPLLFVVRRRKAVREVPIEQAPPTIAERLRPLVELAGTGQLTTAGKAELERLLFGHWRQRLGLESLDYVEGLARLREHAEAGALLRALEDWLHRPPGTVKVDVDSVLAPYLKAETPEGVSERITEKPKPL